MRFSNYLQSAVSTKEVTKLLSDSIPRNQSEYLSFLYSIDIAYEDQMKLTLINPECEVFIHILQFSVICFKDKNVYLVSCKALLKAGVSFTDSARQSYGFICFAINWFHQANCIEIQMKLNAMKYYCKLALFT